MPASSPRLPAPVDLRRLADEEAVVRRGLAALEARIREYEDVERPAYDAWVRLELGPTFAALAEETEALRARSFVADRVSELVDDEGFHPREALYLVTESPGRSSVRRDDLDREEIEARRRAKRDRKRAARRAARRGSRVSGEDGERNDAATRRVTVLYRALARRLHPDSATVVAGLDPLRVQAVWLEVQSAYGVRSLERLLAISAWLETAAEAAPGEARESSVLRTPAERHESLRTLRRASRALEARLAELEGEPGWGFTVATPRTRRQLKRDAIRRLEAELADVREARRAIDEFLASIGPPRPPRAGRQR